MKVIYNKTDGKIITAIPNYMDYKKMFYEFDEVFIMNLEEILVDNFQIENIYTHKIKNGKIVPYSELELLEITKYGRVLLEYERTLEELKPSKDEVKKAETTIEILSLLQEVI